MYESEAKRLDKLHASVATAARFGVFRIEGSKAARMVAAGQLGDRIRVLKSVDPTLGLYAAYAYAEAGFTDRVRSVRGYMQSDLHIDLFDVAMLAGELTGKPLDERTRTYPFCPMLSQGWALLRARNVKLPDGIVPLGGHLQGSLWTTFDRDGMEVVEGALRVGRVA